MKFYINILELKLF